MIMLFSFFIFLGFAEVTPQFSATEVGCARIYDVQTKVDQSFGDHCHISTPPCSTFKIAMAEIAFERDQLKTEEKFIWNGTQHSRAELNRNHTSHTWMQDSVVWVTDLLVNRVGLDPIKKKLTTFKYGNAETSASQFWLNGHLLISPNEQWDYLKRHDNPSLKKAIGLLPQEKFLSSVVYGKTGSCSLDSQSFGWYVGHIFKGDKLQKVFVFRITSKTVLAKEPMGFRAKNIAMEYFKK